MISGKVGRLASYACLAIAPAQASVVISTDATANMSCEGGTCTATAADAVLNVNDLAGMLASGDVTVASGSLARDIQVEAALSWTSTSRLTLDSYRAIAFDRAVVVAGPGAMTITVDDGGTGGDFTFGRKGHIEFWDTNSSLVIGGQSYTLVRQLSHLARLARKNPAGLYALARNYKADKLGIYTKLVIPKLDGVLEGLGNEISDLTQQSNTDEDAFCAENNGTIRDIALVNVNITGQDGWIAGLVAKNNGTILNVSVSGHVSGTEPGMYMGGLVAENRGTISFSHSSASVDGGDDLAAGGLVGNHFLGTIDKSYATGSVTGGGHAGGLVGENGSNVSQSYATGAVSTQGVVGGLIGSNESPVSNVYATGSVTGDTAGGLIGIQNGNPIAVSNAYSTGAVSGSFLQGGFVGEDSGEVIANSYWDMKTSGISDPGDGAGTPKNDPGIMGLTNKQLKSGLPAGFDPAIWAQDPHINKGYPYLRATPPG